MAMVGPKKDGGPNVDFFQSPESLAQFDQIRVWLQKNCKKHVQTDPPTKEGLAQLVIQLIQYQENKLGKNAADPPFLRLPMKVFMDMKPGGSLCTALATMFRFKSEQRWRKFDFQVGKVCTTAAPPHAASQPANRQRTIPEKRRRLGFTTPPSLSLFRQMVAGGAAGACQIVVTTPMELLKIQMQDAGRQAAAAKAGATAARDISFSCVYFPGFAILNGLGPKAPGAANPPFWWSFLSGCTAGCMAALAVNPMDVIKTRMQTITDGGRQYNSILHCFTSTLKEEGPLAFFKGGACRVMVIAPLFGIAQTVYYIGIAEYLLGYK